MRSTVIVITSPRFNQLLGVRDRFKAVHVQTFVAQPPVEAFDKGIFHGLSGSNEVERDTSLVRPFIERAGSGRGEVVEK